jgi:hypothetical protein
MWSNKKIDLKFFLSLFCGMRFSCQMLQPNSFAFPENENTKKISYLIFLLCCCLNNAETLHHFTAHAHLMSTEAIMLSSNVASETMLPSPPLGCCNQQLTQKPSRGPVQSSGRRVQPRQNGSASTPSSYATPSLVI